MPDWRPVIRSRLASLSIAPAREADILEEWSQHLDDRWRELVAGGADPNDAERTVLAELQRSDLLARRLAPLRRARWTDLSAPSRQRWSLLRWVDCLGRDLSYATRVWRKSPAFTLAIVLSLALGIGANTAIFSLLDAVMWRMLPVRDPAGLWAVEPHLTFDQYRLLRDSGRAVELAGYAPVRLNVTIDGHPEPTVDGQLVSGSYFPLLGVRPVLGRTIGPNDDRVPNGQPVAMISYSYWQRRFNRAPDVVGRSLTISGTRFTVIGVTPAEFFGADVGSNPDIFLPLMMQPTAMPAAENLLENPIVYSTWITPLARLGPGWSANAAADALYAIWQPMLPSGVKFGGPPDRLTLVPASTGLSSLRQRFSHPLQVLMAVVGIVLLIACANTATLLLARAAARQTEFAMRLGLGAGKWRITRQLLVECIVLAAVGGVCGILLAEWTTRLLVAFMSSGRSPITLDLDPSVRVLAFTTAVSIATGVVFGMAPAWRAASTDIWRSLKNLGEATKPFGGLRSGKVLAVAQVALSLVLLITAGLFVRSLNAMSGDDFGTSRDSVLVMPVQPRGSDQRNVPGTTARLDQQYRELLSRVRALPGVRSASIAEPTPMRPLWGQGAIVTAASGEPLVVAVSMLYSGYFATVGVPMAAGRDFRDDDLAEDAPAVCVVNEAFVRKVYPGQNAVGRTCVRMHRPNARDPTGPHYGSDEGDYRIVGVVSDARYSNPTGEAPPIVFTPFLQTPTGRGQMVLYARVRSDAGAAIQVRIRDVVRRLDPTLPLFDVHTLAQEMDAALVQERLVALLSVLFGGLALLLACVGLYGLLAFGVEQRRREIGIRLALGADRARVIRLVLREAIVLVALGIAIGIPAAFGAARLAGSRIAGLLFGLSATDPATMALAAVVLVGVAFSAAYLPAWRASRIDPIVTLKAE